MHDVLAGRLHRQCLQEQLRLSQRPLSACRALPNPQDQSIIVRLPPQHSHQQLVLNQIDCNFKGQVIWHILCIP